MPIHIFILSIFIALFSLIPNKKDDCQLIFTLLSIEEISKDMQSYSNNSLRLFDLCNKIDENKCFLNQYSINILDKLVIDLNTGAKIDFFLTKFKKYERNKYKCIIYYVREARNGTFDIIIKVDYELLNKNGKFSILNYKTSIS